jgi:hypothetical protein
MQVDERPEVKEEEQDRLNVYMPAVLRKRLKNAADKRGTSESATAVKFLERSLDWFEGLSRDESDAV